MTDRAGKSDNAAEQFLYSALLPPTGKSETDQSDDDQVSPTRGGLAPRRCVPPAARADRKNSAMAKPKEISVSAVRTQAIAFANKRTYAHKARRTGDRNHLR